MLSQQLQAQRMLRLCALSTLALCALSLCAPSEATAAPRFARRHRLARSMQPVPKAAPRENEFLDRCRGEVAVVRADDELTWWAEVKALAEQRVRALQTVTEEREDADGGATALPLTDDAAAIELEQGTAAGASAEAAEEEASAGDLAQTLTSLPAEVLREIAAASDGGAPVFAPPEAARLRGLSRALHTAIPELDMAQLEGWPWAMEVDDPALASERDERLEAATGAADAGMNMPSYGALLGRWEYAGPERYASYEEWQASEDYGKGYKVPTDPAHPAYGYTDDDRRIPAWMKVLPAAPNHWNNSEGARETAEAALANEDKSGAWLQGHLEVPVEQSNYSSFTGRFRTLDGVEFWNVALYDPLLAPHVDATMSRDAAMALEVSKEHSSELVLCDANRVTEIPGLLSLALEQLTVLKKAFSHENTV